MNDEELKIRKDSDMDLDGDTDVIDDFDDEDPGQDLDEDLDEALDEEADDPEAADDGEDFDEAEELDDDTAPLDDEDWEKAENLQADKKDELSDLVIPDFITDLGKNPVETEDGDGEEDTPDEESDPDTEVKAAPVPAQKQKPEHKSKKKAKKKAFKLPFKTGKKSAEASGKKKKTRPGIFAGMSRTRQRNTIVIMAVVILLILLKVFLGFRVASKYSVLETTPREGSANNSYESFCGGILRYSSDGAALTGSDGSSIWNETFDMDTPKLDIDGNTAAVYDQKGTKIYVFGSKGLLGTVTTDLPILKARVSAAGTIATILEDGETTWLNFYSTQGETIATGKTRIDSPGYPVDVDVSENGQLMVVSYVYVDETSPTSYVAFYNFGSAGQNQMDNLVSAYTYPDVMVPEVSFVNSSTAVAVRDDGLTVYTGSRIPAESFKTDVDEEIVSCFYCESSVGLITSNDDEDKPFKMTLYNLKGKAVKTKNFSGDYTTIRVDDDMIFLYNDRQVTAFTDKGKEKFHGVIAEGAVQDVCKISSDRFLIVMGSALETIKIK